MKTPHIHPPPVVNCLGKEALKSKSLATQVAKRVSSRHDSVVTAYKCIYCGYYHVGSHERRKK